MNETQKPKVLNFVLVMVLIVLIAVWFFIALPDQDWLWFLPVFNEQAGEIRLYRDGQEIRLFPGDEGYERVNEAVNSALTGIKAKIGGAVSEEALQDFRDKYSAVEVFYNDPVIVHSHHAFRKCDKLIFPLSGRYDDPPRVFGGTYLRRDYRAGALVLKEITSLRQAVDALWAAQESDTP